MKRHVINRSTAVYYFPLRLLVNERMSFLFYSYISSVTLGPGLTFFYISLGPKRRQKRKNKNMTSVNEEIKTKEIIFYVIAVSFLSFF